ALRHDLREDPSFLELLARARTAALDAFAHQDLPFEKVVEEVQPRRDPSRPPLFQVLVVLQNTPAAWPDLPEVAVEAMAVDGDSAKFDLTLALAEAGDGSLTGSLEYVVDLFDRSTVLRLLGHLGRTLESIAKAPRRRLSEIDPAGEPERHQLVFEWNDTAFAVPVDLYLHELVSAQARRTPEAVAAVFEGESLTYEELDRRTTALALHLLDLGVRVEDRVGVLVERSLEMIVGLLGVLKAGAAYVPLDPGYPDLRLALLIENAGVSVVLAQARWLPLLPARGERAVVLDEPLPESSSSPASLPALTGRNLAYTLYTSGSTGTPKGVMIPHQGIVNRLLWMHEAFGLTSRDRILQKTPFSFDVSLWELFNPLIAGARLVFARPEGHKDPAYLADLMVREGITSAHFVPSMLQVFLEERDLPAMPALRQVMASGEALPPDLARRFYDRISGVRLHNLYGPTEASVEVSFWACEPRASRVPIGRPIRNLGLYVVDRQVRPQPLGVPGELLLGGVGLARGYLGRPDLTAAAFVPSPFGDEPGARLYRTGDLARTLPDGAVEYLGRIDHQVKIRGVRIEPGEIEALLPGIPGVAAAAVVVPPGLAAVRRLVAFVVPQPEAALDPAVLRRQLQGQVPEAMVPSAWFVLDALPLTSNGKVDRRALILLAGEPAQGEVPAVSPRTQTEQILAGIWSQLLGRAGIGVLDDFFELGGHSLLATRVMSRIRQAFGVDLPLRQIFQWPTVAGLAARIEAEGATARNVEPPLLAVPREDNLPLSLAQERLWFLDQLDPGSPAYNIPAAVRLTGPVDEAVLERCLEEVVRRHEAVRTTFEMAEGLPVQRIAAAVSWRLPVVDLSALSDGRREEEARRLALAESLQPFDLARGPLLRALLVRESPHRRALLLTLHHIVSDGWSMGVLVGEITVLYPVLARGERSPLPDLPVQYADFAVWQRRRLAGEVLERQSEFWRRTLAGAPQVLELPADRPRPAAQSFRGAQVGFEISADCGVALRALARRESATPFMVLSAAFAALLGRWSGQQEVVLGTPVANRTRPEIEGLIGFFVNTLALRHDLHDDPSFLELLARVRAAALDAFAHQDLPFEKVVEEVQPQRDPSRSPLFQALLILQNTPAPWPDLPEVKVAEMEVAGSTAKFDLTLSLAEGRAGSFAGTLSYAADLFERPTMLRLLGHLGRVLESVAGDPRRRLSQIDLAGEPERHQLAREWNDTAWTAPAGGSLPELIAAQARRTPEAVAAVFQGESLTYRELERHATALAEHLVCLGVPMEGRVGVLVERSLEMIVGLLGVLKVGAAYVPLDPSYPAERLDLLIESAGVSVVLAQERLIPLLSGRGERVVVLDGPLAEASAPVRLPVLTGQNLAYTLYTSGSTGTPKGVMIPHQGIVNRLLWMQAAYGLSAEDRVLQKTPFSFDVSLWELFWPLITGGRLVFARPEGHKDPAYLADLMEREGITTLHFVPSMLQVFLEEPDLPAFSSLRRVMASGEALPPDLVRRFYSRISGARLHNLYGPTEASVDVSFWSCGPDASRVPIGRPISNLSLYVADRDFRLQPLGVPGELLLGGVGLARGYLGRPDLTAAAFVPDPFGEELGERLYRTGDLSRTLPDGAVEYLGRIDHQVKIRGVRIEPGEIEALLSNCVGIAAAAVVVPPAPAAARRLVACVVSQPGAAADLASFRRHLQGQVPEVMVPAVWIALDSLPLTPNGKVDRRALIRLAEEHESGRDEGAAVAPRTQAEEILAGIWSVVLGVPALGVFDDFFELGGHSLLATRVMSRIRQAFGVDLPLRQIFQWPTVAGLAARIEAEG
ncbi:MAG TPA: amino acid adenylation domain-containing protein, partial [Thermoanaerobaculia bacterium]|nr:amino acid adenylation domain-containing protein [Thermoanaerobaculia bacterium]